MDLNGLIAKAREGKGGEKQKSGPRKFVSVYSHLLSELSDDESGSQTEESKSGSAPPPPVDADEEYLKRALSVDALPFTSGWDPQYSCGTIPSVQYIPKVLTRQQEQAMIGLIHDAPGTACTCVSF